MATIITKNSSTPSSVPTAGNLEQGELAVNVADKRLFTEDSTGSVVELGTNPSSLTTSTVDIDGGAIDNTIIGGSGAAAGTFTTLNAASGGSLTGTWSDLGTVTTVDINGGTIDNTVIGGTTPAAVSGTTGTFTGAFTSVGIDDNATSNVVTVNDTGLSLDGGTAYLSSPANNALYFDGNIYGAFATFTTSIDWRESHIQTSVSGNVTFSDTNKPTSGQSATIIVEIDYTSGTITWPTAWDWPGGSAPTLDSGKNIICATVRDGTNVYAVKINSGAFS